MNTVSHPYVDKVTSVTRDGVVTKFHYNARGMFATSRPSGTSAANPPDLARIPSDFCQIALLCFANPTKSWLKRIEFSLRSPKVDWLLVAKERDGKIIETLGWDGIGLIARSDTVFANEAHISGGVPLVAATSDGSDASYFDSDYLGTTTASYTADGEVNAYEHGSFGQGTEIADARFTGKHYDADLGAHVFPFRNYRSDAGRWTSADPAGFPDGPNQHFYAPVPTMGLDPLGLEEWTTVTDTREVPDGALHEIGLIPEWAGGGIKLYETEYDTNKQMGADWITFAPGSSVTRGISFTDTLNLSVSGGGSIQVGVSASLSNTSSLSVTVGAHPDHPDATEWRVKFYSVPMKYRTVKLSGNLDALIFTPLTPWSNNTYAWDINYVLQEK